MFYSSHTSHDRGWGKCRAMQEMLFCETGGYKAAIAIRNTKLLSERFEFQALDTMRRPLSKDKTRAELVRRHVDSIETGIWKRQNSDLLVYPPNLSKKICRTQVYFIDVINQNTGMGDHDKSRAPHTLHLIQTCAIRTPKH